MQKPRSPEPASPRRRLGLAIAIALGACGDDKSTSGAGPAVAKPSPAAVQPAPPKPLPAGWADAERIDATRVANAASAFPAKCPRLDGPVLLVTLQGLRRARGIPDTDDALVYQQDQLTPAFLRKLAVPADTTATTFASNADPALWAVLEGAKTVGILELTAHRSAKLLDASGNEVLVSMERVTKALPGAIDAWLFVIDRANGAAVCHVKARVTHPAGTMETIGLQIEALDDWLRRTLVQALGAKLAKAAGATLVDETGPVSASERFRVAERSAAR